MNMPAARLGDPMDHGSGVLVSASSDVFMNGIPAGCVSISGVSCEKHGSSQCVTVGPSMVLINGQCAAYVGSSVSCGGVVVSGSPDILIGG